MYVIPRDACPYLYVQLSIVDRHDTVIDFANDSVGAVGPRQRAKLIFESFADGAYTAHLSNIGC